MRTRIKICGIASNDEAHLAVNAGADALGLNCVGLSSPRHIGDAAAAAIIALTSPPVATFLLTVERAADAISAHVRRTHPTVVQILWGIEPAEAARLAAIEPHVRRVQVIHVESRAVLEMIPLYSPHVHAFLLDSGRPSAAMPELGGTGRPHDWAISAEFVETSPLPVFLAGGLTSVNVGAAIRQVRPFGLDLSSGVRTAGQLDPGKLAAFVSAVREADEAKGSA